MNSPEAEFDAFYTEDEIDRPFIETTKRRELPIQTKVVVKQGQSNISFFVDKKLVVTGANGFMLLRMYLSPLAKDDNGDYVFVPPESPGYPDTPVDPEVHPTEPGVSQENEGPKQIDPPSNFSDVTMTIPD